MNAPVGIVPVADEYDTRPLLGIGLKVGSVLIFVCMSALLKLTEGIPTGQLVFFRSFFAIFPIVLYLLWTNQLKGALVTSNGFSHFWRGLVGTIAMFCNFGALILLPLPETIAINYASPLLIVILSAVFLHEKVRFYRWSAVMIGLGGVIMIVWPKLSLLSNGLMGQKETVGVILALMAAFSTAVAMLLVRRLVKGERTSTIVIYFSLTSSALALLTLPFGWVVPNGRDLVLLISAGFAGGVAQILLTQCYRHAEMSTIAPFEYTSMLLGLLIGYLVFHDVATMQMLVGSGVVIAAGIYIICREGHLSRRKKKRKSA